MSHGEQWVVPLNYVVIGSTLLFWTVFLPLWSTVLIALPIALILGYFARDKYGGLQICLLVAPAWFGATVGLARAYRHAVESHTELPLGRLIFSFLGTLVTFPVLLLAALTVVFGVLLAWEWLCEKLRSDKRQGRASSITPDRDEPANPPGQRQ